MNLIHIELALYFILFTFTSSTITSLKAFIRKYAEPVERQINRELRELNSGGDWQNWKLHLLIEEFKEMAKEQGLWNLFLPDETLGRSLTKSEYAPLAEEMGRMLFTSEIFNCNAPDRGNMEVLYLSFRQ